MWMDSFPVPRTTVRSLSMRLGASLAAATVALTGAAPAHARLNSSSASEASTSAYRAYEGFRRLEISLAEATKKTIAAINAAKTEILVHTDRLAAAEVRTCADSAVINVADLEAFTPSGRQVFALNATECVTKASSLLPVVTTIDQADELGFALNAVGPIALLARSSAGLDTTALRAALARANNTLTARLSETTGCRSQLLDGDSPPGGVISAKLTCTAYNNDTGSHIVDCACRPGQPRPPFDYTVARDKALRNTSHSIAKAVLPVLQA